MVTGWGVTGPETCPGTACEVAAERGCPGEALRRRAQQEVEEKPGEIQGQPELPRWEGPAAFKQGISSTALSVVSCYVLHHNPCPFP